MNPTQLTGISFVEFAAPKPEALEQLFYDFGFSKIMKHANRNVYLFQQNKMFFLLNAEENSYAGKFSKIHGPCISSMGWNFKEHTSAFRTAMIRGAKPCTEHDYNVPAIHGIGDSLIYFVPEHTGLHYFESLGFRILENPVRMGAKGFTAIDHLTNNVPYGEMKKWALFYKEIFGFTEVRYFDIRGVATGLTSFALRSPDGSFCIPINEATEKESQINEYLREYKGAGIQHLAFLTDNILESLDALKGTKIETLDMDEDYYAEAFQRVPQVTENKDAIRKHNVLIDGDEKGYLLQIFTKNIIGPIFIEIIQRKNHLSFGEGNFSALFRSIERDQMKRGVLQTKTTENALRSSP